MKLPAHFESKSKDEIIKDLIRLQQENEQIQRALTERNKELTAIYKFSSIMDRTGQSLPEIMQQTIDLLPASWQYPECTCARMLTVAGEYTTAKFRETQWKQSEIVYLDDQQTYGCIEVFYLEEKPEEFEGPFLLEERKLLNVICERLGKMVSRKLLEEKLAAIFLESPIAKCIIDIENNFVFADVNESMLQLIGYRREEVIGKRPSAVGLFHDKQTAQQILDEINRNGYIRNFQYDYVTKDGQVKTTILNAKTISIDFSKLLVASFFDRTEIERLKEAEKNANELNQVLIDSIPYGMEIMDEKGNVIYVNSIMKNIVDEENTLTRKCLHTNNPAKFCSECPVPKNIKIGETLTVETKARKSGLIYRVSHVGFKYRGEKVILKLVEDITAQKETENKLLETNLKLQGFLDNMDDAFFQIDSAGIINFTNPGAAKMFGYSINELIEMPAENLYADRTKREGYIRKVMDRGRISDHPIHMKRKNGREFWGSVNSKAIYDHDGTFLMSQNLVRDVTPRIEMELLLKNAKEAAEKSEKRLLDAIDNMSEGYTIIGFDFVYQYINKAARHRSKFPADWMLGKTFEEVWPGQSHSEMFRCLKSCLNERKFHSFESEWEIKGGEKRWFLVRMQPIAAGALVLSADITESKKYEQEILAAKEKAEESDRLKSAFLMNISHEIRTPMNGILGFLELLQDPELTESEKSEFIAIVNKSGERLLSTINDIVEISKIEVGDINLRLEEVDVSELMLFYTDFFSLQAREKNLQFSIEQQIDSKDARIKTDKVKLDGIMMNLIKNAIKFTQQGKIEIGNFVKNERLYFYVKDTGNGIPADKVEAIFERFVQADLGNSRNYEGSGIGLSLVRAYLNSMDGDIDVATEPGKGSIFQFYIPYHPLESVSEQQAPVFPKTVAKKHTILIAEDDPINFAFLNKILSPGFDILHVEAGDQAVKMFSSRPDVSLVLMDVKMPGEYDGLEASKRIRKSNPGVKIIAQTAYAIGIDKGTAIEAGCNDYISKPFKADELLKLIDLHIK